MLDTSATNFLIYTETLEINYKSVYSDSGSLRDKIGKMSWLVSKVKSVIEALNFNWWLWDGQLKSHCMVSILFYPGDLAGIKCHSVLIKHGELSDIDCTV